MGLAKSANAHADLYRTAIDRIEDKRDMHVYETEGRPLWLVIGVRFHYLGLT